MIRVLIVEDDPMVSKINKKYIESVEGFKVEDVCRDETETLKYIKNNPVDLIILDLYLPRGDGLSILRKVREKNYNCDIIMVTASADSSDIDEALKLGAVDYLIKPFEYKRMKQALEKYISRKELINKEDISQIDIDNIILKKSGSDRDLEKGLNKYTLGSIISFLDESDVKKLSAEDISTGLDVSKVTVRRYMDYLEEINYVIREIEYGSIGRPMHYYRKI
nr:response regulator [Tissierella sp.]